MISSDILKIVESLKKGDIIEITITNESILNLLYCAIFNKPIDDITRIGYFKKITDDRLYLMNTKSKILNDEFYVDINYIFNVNIVKKRGDTK